MSDLRIVPSVARCGRKGTERLERMEAGAGGDGTPNDDVASRAWQRQGGVLSRVPELRRITGLLAEASLAIDPRRKTAAVDPISPGVGARSVPLMGTAFTCRDSQQMWRTAEPLEPERWGMQVRHRCAKKLLRGPESSGTRFSGYATANVRTPMSLCLKKGVFLAPCCARSTKDSTSSPCGGVAPQRNKGDGRSRCVSKSACGVSARISRDKAGERR